jgi:hypothetical protein
VHFDDEGFFDTELGEIRARPPVILQKASAGGQVQFQLARNAANQPVYSRPLNAGRHSLEIFHRGEQSILDTVYLIPSAGLTDELVVKMVQKGRTLSFDLSSITGKEGVFFQADLFVTAGGGSYEVKNPRIALKSGSLRVKGVKPLINDVFNPVHATYAAIDRVVFAPGATLSTSTLVMLKDKGPDEDQFSFTFDTLEWVP